jgi:hypothetical protein
VRRRRLPVETPECLVECLDESANFTAEYWEISIPAEIAS